MLLIRFLLSDQKRLKDSGRREKNENQPVIDNRDTDGHRIGNTGLGTIG